MEDKLDELKNNKGTEQQNEDVNEDQIIIMNEPEADLMPEFQRHVDNAQRILEKIRGNNEEIKELKGRYARATTTQAEKEVSASLNLIIESNKTNQRQLKDVMVQISEEVEKAKNEQPEEPETRMKMDMQSAITLKMQDVLKEEQEVEMDFQGGLKNKITRQTRLLDPNLDDQQIDDICQDPQKANDLLQQKLYGQASVQLQNAVADIQDKYRDIQKLEQSVNQVYQLFQDLALLVHHQGQLIDNIELNIKKAQNYVSKGERQLRKAKEEHQASRKKMCFLIMIGLLIVLVIVGPILGTSL